MSVQPPPPQLLQALDALITSQDAEAARRLLLQCADPPAHLRPLVALNLLLCEFICDVQDGHRVWHHAQAALELAAQHTWYVPVYNLAALMLSTEACERAHPGSLALAIEVLGRAAAASLHPQTFLLASAVHMKANRMAEATSAYAKAAALGAGVPATEHVVRAYCDTGDASMHLLHRGAATLLDTLYAADLDAEGLLTLHAACFQHLPVRVRAAPSAPRIAFVSEHLAPGSILSNTEPFLRRMRDALVVSLAAEDSAFTSELRALGRLLPPGADALREAGVGVVVCLDGCTGTLTALDYVSRAAPEGAAVVQAVGYAHPTCHPSVHFRLTDRVADPPAPAPPVVLDRPLERELHLDPCFLCWQPPVLAAPHRRLADRDAFVANHNFKKLSPPTLALYASVLEACPGATLTFKPTSPLTVHQRRWLHSDARLSALLEAGRVLVEDAIADQGAYSAFLSRFRVCLDCTPYNGTVTTLEALWNDVAVVTLTGACHRARVTTSILHAVGRPEWCASDADEYVRTARHLWLAAREPGAVRAALASSPILDHDGYTQRLHACLTSLPGEI